MPVHKKTTAKGLPPQPTSGPLIVNTTSVNEEDKESTDGEDEEVENSFNELLGTFPDDEEKQEDQPQELNSAGKLNSIKAIVESCPATMFGIQCRKEATATFGNQLGIMGKMIEIADKAESTAQLLDATFDELHDLKGVVSSQAATNKTLADGEKAKMQIWKDSLRKEVQQWLPSVNTDVQDTITAQFRGVVTQEFQESIRKIVVDLAIDKIKTGALHEQSTTIADPQNTTSSSTNYHQEDELPPSAIGTNDQMRKRPSMDTTSSIEGYVIPKKIMKTPEDMLLRFKRAQQQAREQSHERQKKPTECELCDSTNHQGHMCPSYLTVADRTNRLIHLGKCLRCRKQHSGQCRYKQPQQCAVCFERHLTMLCPHLDAQ